MVVVNGTEDCRVTDEDLHMESAEQNRVTLPFTGKPWGDLLLEIADAVLDRVSDDDFEESMVYDFERLVHNFSTELFFNIQPSRVAVTAYINVSSPLVGDFRDRVFLRAANDEIKDILDKFFFSGASGLTRKYAEYYDGKYRAWLAKNF